MRELFVQFYRQKPIGPYIVDFLAKEPNIIIEIDGEHHYEPEQRELDNIRDAFLRNQGFIVLRFDNNSVMSNPDGVLQTIIESISKLKTRSKKLTSI